VTYEVRETPEANRVHEKVLKGAARKRYEASTSCWTTSNGGAFAAMAFGMVE